MFRYELELIELETLISFYRVIKKLYSTYLCIYRNLKIMAEVKSVVSMYTESTPNPETQKFVVNRMLLQGNSVEYKTKEDATGSALALGLFEMSFVNGVFISNNFITVTKHSANDWFEITPHIKENIRLYLSEENPVFTDDELEAIKDRDGNAGDRTDLENKIIEILDTYVQPAVAGDGGSIVFRSFNEGIVTLGMQGACSGCPSSTITLKSGIEGLLKRFVPEVTEVVAEGM